MIETTRTQLRKFTLDDVPAAFEMNRDPMVRRYIIGEPAPTLESVRRLIEENTLRDYEKHGFGRLAIIHKEDNRFIGFTGLKFCEDLNEVDVGYRLVQKYWGKGLATECTLPTIKYGFEQLELKRIIAAAVPENLGSINVMKKLGMQFDREQLIDDVDMVVYAIDRERWLQLQDDKSR